jgi:hypothetical protein
MIPEFPYNLRITLSRLKKNWSILTLLCPFGCLSLAETANRAEIEQHQDATKKKSGQSYSYITLIMFYKQRTLQMKD